MPDPLENIYQIQNLEDQHPIFGEAVSLPTEISDKEEIYEDAKSQAELDKMREELERIMNLSSEAYRKLKEKEEAEERERLRIKVEPKTKEEFF